MNHICCERLVFLSPSIEGLISSIDTQRFCVSRICAVRSHLKCCYISFENFLIEILEVTDVAKAKGFAFFNQACNLSSTTWVGIGLRTDDLDFSLKIFQEMEITASEYYTSTSTYYPKGYKHRSALLSLRWYGKTVYLTEYDPSFFKERETDITQDTNKKSFFSIEYPELAVQSSFTPPFFLKVNQNIPEIHLLINPTTNSSPLSESLDLGWITFKTG